MSDNISCEVWDEIQLTNLKNQWISNFITLYNGCYYLLMQGLKLNHVSKRDPKTSLFIVTICRFINLTLILNLNFIAEITSLPWEIYWKIKRGIYHIELHNISITVSGDANLPLLRYCWHRGHKSMNSLTSVSRWIFVCGSNIPTI